MAFSLVELVFCLCGCILGNILCHISETSKHCAAFFLPCCIRPELMSSSVAAASCSSSCGVKDGDERGGAEPGDCVCG